MLLFLGEAAEAAVLISFLLCLAAGKARGKNRKLDLSIHSYFGDWKRLKASLDNGLSMIDCLDNLSMLVSYFEKIGI